MAISSITSFIVSFLISMSYADTSKNARVTLLFVGDISFAGPVKYYVEHGHYTYNDSFNEVAPFVREADISVGNLESPFVDKHVYPYMYKDSKKIILDSSPSAASSLSFAGFDAVSLANNHFNDFGSKGVSLTVDILKKTGIKYFGDSYGKWDTSQKPLILEAKGMKIGFLGYCDSPSRSNKNCTEMRMLFEAGPAIYTDNIATRDVNSLKKAKVDIIVVLIHFGQELYRKPLPYQLRISKHLMSLGVQVIIGAHPHVLQPHCRHDNKLLAYSLGNFLFYPKQPYRGSALDVYGRLGMQPNKNKIDAYEHFVLGNSENLKMTRMLKVTVTRNGVLDAEYLPVKLQFDKETKRIYPEPIKNAKWISVCGKGDTQCQNSCKVKENKKLR